MSHLIGVRKKADSQKGVREAKSWGTSRLIHYKKEFLLEIRTQEKQKHQTFSALRGGSHFSNLTKIFEK